MRMPQYGSGGTSRQRRTDQQAAPRVYTPTMNGFERFVRESVGLASDAPGDGQGGDESPHEGRNRR
jgi:hypothetical protein